MNVHTHTEFEREIRDPIHKYIKLTELENAIIDSTYFRRLANISQMHSAHLVYPGATYPRKIHSLGSMHVAHRMAACILYQQAQSHVDELSHPLLYNDQPLRRDDWDVERELDLEGALDEEGVHQNEEDIVPYLLQIIRVAALVHDIGHGPYSHLFESASEDGDEEPFDHEEQTVFAIEEHLGEIEDDNGDPYLSEQDRRLLKRIIEGDSLRSTELVFLHEIISSPLDADKLDYLLRDSYYAGTPEYGTVDLDRITDALIVSDGELHYVSESLDAIVNALNHMFFMYNTVYLHKTVRGFDLAAERKLSEVSDYISGFQEDDSFFDLNDHTFMLDLQEESDGSDRFETALEGLKDLRARKKKLKALVDARHTMPIGYADLAFEDEIDRIREPLEEQLEIFARQADLDPADFEIDLEKDIRPIGLKTDELVTFLTEPRIYDVNRGAEKKFMDYRPHYKTLTRVVVPVRVFGPYEDVKNVSGTAKGRFNNEVDEILERRIEARGG